MMKIAMPSGMSAVAVSRAPRIWISVICCTTPPASIELAKASTLGAKRSISLYDELQLLDQRPHLGDLLAQHVAHLGRGRAGRLGANLLHALAQVGMAGRCRNVLLQP